MHKSNGFKKIFSLLTGIVIILFLFSGCLEKSNNIESEETTEQTIINEIKENKSKSEQDTMSTNEQEITLSNGEISVKAYLKRDPISYSIVSNSNDNYKYNLKGVKNLKAIAAVTGEYSINKTITNYSVAGTDLGIIFSDSNKMYIAFGDTFSKENFSGNWRSNVLAVTTDKEPSDGILFDTMISHTGLKTAKEIIRSKKIDNVEMTVIPTGGLSVEENLYLCYMSVKKWGKPGQWTCNFGSMAKSTDEGKIWIKLNELKWPGDTHFAQLCPIVKDEYVFYFGITGGRFGPVNLMRVKIENIENFNEYEYLTNLNDDGSPVWEKGNEAMYNAYPVIDAPAGELSVMYNVHLEEWIITYLGGADLVIRSSKTLWGPFSKAHKLVSHNDYAGLYGAFMHPNLVENNGEKIYFLMSLWDPVYNVLLMEAELIR